MAEARSHSILLDGNIIQYAGELFYNADITRETRVFCRATYRRALEDFAFATVLGETFSASANLQRMGDEQIGKTLVDEFKDWFIPVETWGSFSPEEIINEQYPDLRKSVKDELGRLSQAMLRDKEAWSHWILREAALRLAEPPLVNTDEPPSDAFRGSERPYITDRELEKHVPSDLMEHLLPAVTRNPNSQHFPTTWLSAFVRRACLTHVVIFRWYEEIGKKAEKQINFTMLPFATRATLVSSRPAISVRNCIKDALVPYILHRATTGVDGRRSLLNRLMAARDEFRKVRELISDAMAEQAEGRAGDAKRLWEEISRLSYLSGGDSVRPVGVKEMHVKIPFIGLTVTVDPKYYCPRRYILQEVVTAPREQVEREVEARLMKIFPELDRVRDQSVSLGYPQAPSTQTAQQVTDRARPGTTPQRYDLFLSHASEDKAEIARPLYESLTARGVTIWFDEAVLELGDSLRRKIDEGLRIGRFGLVILSPHFFAKQWPQRELDGLVARETVSGEKAILPVWHRVEREDVLQYSATLADRVAAKSNEGVSSIAEKVLRVLGK